MEQCCCLTVSTRHVHQFEFVIPCLPHRMFVSFLLTSWINDHVCVAGTQNMGWIPALRFDHEQSHGWDDHNEIRISPPHYGLVINDDVVRQFLEQRESSLFTSTGAARQTIWYHLGQEQPPLLVRVSCAMASFWLFRLHRGRLFSIASGII